MVIELKCARQTTVHSFLAMSHVLHMYFGWKTEEVGCQMSEEERPETEGAGSPMSEVIAGLVSNLTSYVLRLKSHVLHLNTLYSILFPLILPLFLVVMAI